MGSVNIYIHFGGIHPDVVIQLKITAASVISEILAITPTNVPKQVLASLSIFFYGLLHVDFYFYEDISY